MKSVSPQIYSLISEIQTFQSVATFSLAGGTSLALRYNHRVSEDIDFFSDNIVGVNGLILIKQQLQKKYKDDLLFCELINEESGDQFCFLRALIRNDNIQVKVEFIQNIFCLEKPEEIKSLRVLSRIDIGVFKLLSAANRKANKDIYDLDIITDELSLNLLWNCFLKRNEMTLTADKKNLFDLDGDINLQNNIVLLLEFDNIEYANIPDKPSHSNDKLRLLPDSKTWTAVKTSWRRKVKNFMIEKGLPIPPIKPIN
mgnify:FL=1